ncbi:hypothetical protein [Microcoleus anatoxicus]|uniref:Uncharacterized protein n=1 Tax=Microcoleus anatoxicus PTRS2 TaxID=2705321 RepID=A0ABU8YTB1_9CYAN
MVFFDELQVDVVGGAIGVIEFATVDAEELQGLVEVDFGDLSGDADNSGLYRSLY